MKKLNTWSGSGLLILAAVVVVLSIGLSVLATLAVDRPIKREASDTVRARKIELVDDRGHVRATLKFGTPTSGVSQPEFLLMDDHGRIAAGIQLTSDGEGSLYFNNNRDKDPRAGMVSVGFLDLGDTRPEPDSFTAWGIRIQSERAITSLGVRNSGDPLGVSGLPGGIHYWKITPP